MSDTIKIAGKIAAEIEAVNPAAKPLVDTAEAEAKSVFSFLTGIGVPAKVAYALTAVAVAVTAALTAHYAYHLF